MTKHARLVLEDCRVALRELQEISVPIGHETPEDRDRFDGEWRRRWVAVVALLRAVGHVLDKVDTLSDPHLREAARFAYERLKSTKPQPSIYWEFIDDERNTILKEYRFRISGVAYGQGVSSLTAFDVTEHANRFGEAHIVTGASGPLAGKSKTALADEGIVWWVGFLTALDAAALEAARQLS